MAKEYNGETIILPGNVSEKTCDSGEKFYLFAFHDGRIERFLLEGVKHLGRMTDDSIPDIRVQNMFLSRSHGYFNVEGSKVTYTAEETTNGIALNGNIIRPGETVVLKDEDELTIPTDRSIVNNNDIILKCAFSPSMISLWDSMVRAQLDELTGLPGRKMFNDKFKLLLSGGAGESWFFIIDVDKFKLINDVYGHTSGDAALQALAAELMKPEYGISISAHWGGDEFVGVISGRKESVAAAMNRLIDRLSSKMINNRFSIFISVGICRISESSGVGQLPLLVENADKALYHAKRSDSEKICFSL